MHVHAHARISVERDSSGGDVWGRYSKELTHAIWDADRCEIHRAGQQSGNSGESEGCLQTEFLPHWRVSFFFLKSFN